ncbi:MAG TPA: acetyl ornithine aminotransferase family protein [Candidatus Thermoplasmatota archaeon]|nr:acetyl ornithine aminotransferase family protein [Candidatus Thermoplasmatota archaeon]
MKPDIRTPIPGPLAQKIVERDGRSLITTTKTSPIAAREAHGVWVTDVDGNTLLDFTAGIGVVNVGHSHPKLVKAMQDQVAKLVHFAGTDFYYESQVEYAERLTSVTPGRFAKKVFYSNSGTESNEAAIKIAKAHGGRQHLLAFLGAFHGRTMGSLGMTASKVTHKRSFFPWMGGVTHAFYPNPYRNIWGIDGYERPDELVDKALDHIETTLFGTILPAEEVAAIFVEPVQGEGGYVVPPKSFFPKLRKLADKHGILVVADEVQTGFGRTGKMFASEHFGLEPDIMSLAKAIANGIPMGAVVARADLDFRESGRHSNTYGGNVLATTAAIATLDILQSERLVENAATVGAHMRKRLEALKDKHACIGDVRGLGLMLATEFVKDRRTKEPDTKLHNRVVEEAAKRGLILLPCGKNSVRYIPPLSITAAEVDAGIDVLDASITAATG